jgi:peptidoglycan/xylan/chitin deacetylase (PgdA/CDA1 family)
MKSLLARSALGICVSTLLAAAGVGVPALAAPGSGGAHGAGHGNCRGGYVGLTFDDGPGATTSALLDALTEHGLRATMFNTGDNARANPDLVRQQVEAGMWVGNHSYTHAHLTQLSPAESFQELASTQWVLDDILGEAPTLFRPPYGETNAELRSEEDQLGLLEVLWTVDSRDWAGASVDDIVAAVASLQPGGIILMHDWPANTVAAIPRIAEVLAAKGMCAGRIAFTPQAIPGVGTTFHAVAVKP